MAEIVQESNENSEATNNITVICNTSREDGSGKKPHGNIHLNPKFLNSTIRKLGPPPRLSRALPNHELQMPFNHAPRHDQRPFHPRYPQALCHPPPYRPNGSPFQGPRLQRPYFPQQLTPPPRFDWHGIPPGFPQDYSQRPPPPLPHTRFQNEFSPGYVDHNSNQPFHPNPPEFQPFHPNPPEFQPQQYDFSQPPPTISWQGETEPLPGPSYYHGFRDEYDHCHPTKWKSSEWMYSRSRSRSRSPCSRVHRSLTRSSGEQSYESGERRSRSLSSDGNRRKRRSFDFSGGNDNMWDSDVERNSDSDLDLSKPLDSLTSNVSDSKSLLKDALKCLGSAKISTMIPAELSKISRSKLFHMCEELLNETENEELIQIMEGKINIEKEQQGTESLDNDNTSQSCHSTNSPPESDDDYDTRQKSHKKKRSKRRKKKRKKERVSQSQDDSGDSGTGHEDDSSSSENCEDNLGVSNPVFSDVDKFKSGPSAGTSQQSLLELIQIEYKTKAINVMLKNLGVATEISSLVSNVLHTSGISAVQAMVANADADTSKQKEEKAESNEAIDSVQGVPVVNLEMTENTAISDSSRQKCDNGSDLDEKEKSQSDSENATNNTTESQNEDCSNTSPTSSASPTKKSGNDSQSADLRPLDELEIFKEVLDDVLDIDVGDNEEIDFLNM